MARHGMLHTGLAAKKILARVASIEAKWKDSIFLFNTLSFFFRRMLSNFLHIFQ
jgi:hypothetical protein